MSNYKSTKTTVDRAFYVRLTEDDYAFLEQLARRNHLKPAVLARKFLLEALEEGVSGVSQNVREYRSVEQ